VAAVSLHILAKAPLPGLVKTRLAAVCGDELALAAYRAMAGNVFCAALASGLPAAVHFAPDDARAAMAGLCAPGFRLVPQAPGDLGARMAAALAEAFAVGDAAALLIGADLPLLTPALLRQAAMALEEKPAVLGPAEDGGYWLIGFTREGFAPEVFADMPWSTAAVAGLTRARLAAAGREFAELTTLPDCDEAADLARLAGPPWRQALGGTPFGQFLEAAPAGLFDQNRASR
jgi:rSAM/selenodomain-associated transferase 1